MTTPVGIIPHDNIAEALYALQQEVGALPRDAANPFFNSHFASFPAIKDRVDPIAKKHGLFVRQTLCTITAGDQTHDVLRNRLYFNGKVEDDDNITMHLPGATPQAHGSATTFYRRYAYTTCLGLVSASDDDDGNAASKPAIPPAATERRPSPLSGVTVGASVGAQEIDEDF